MMTAIIVIIVVLIFYVIVSLFFLEGWHSFRDTSMLGGLLILWIALLIFFLIIYLAARHRQNSNPQKTGFMHNFPISLVITEV